MYLGEKTPGVEKLMDEVIVGYDKQLNIKSLEFRGKEIVSSKKEGKNGLRTYTLDSKNSEEFRELFTKLTNETFRAQVENEMLESASDEALANASEDLVKSEREINKRKLRIEEEKEKVVKHMKEMVIMEEEITSLRGNEPLQEKSKIRKVIDFIKEHKRGLGILGSIFGIIGGTASFLNFVLDETGQSTVIKSIKKTISGLGKKLMENGQKTLENSFGLTTKKIEGYVKIGVGSVIKYIGDKILYFIIAIVVALVLYSAIKKSRK